MMEGADLNGGEGALAAAVAEYAVEVEGEQIAAHRGAQGLCRPCSSPQNSSGRRNGPNEVGADSPYSQGGAAAQATGGW